MINIRHYFEVLEIVESGSQAFVNEQYDIALTKFKSALIILEKSNSEDKENFQYMIEYLLSITLLQFNKLQDLLEALDILIKLEKNMESKYPIVYYGLAKAYIKLHRFNLANNKIQQGFDIINKGIYFETFTIPLTCLVLKETTKEGLLLSLLELHEIASKWHYPDAKCALENCKNVIPHCPLSRDIYYSDPSFTGLVNIICSNKHLPCKLKYHPNCWKFIKHEIDSSKELSDSEMLGRLCLKPNCTNTNDISIIVKIEIYNHEAKIKEIVEDSSLLILLKYSSPVSKGAIKKQKLTTPKTPILQQQDDHKTEKELEREITLQKLKELRQNYFDPLREAEYEIDLENKKIDDANQFHRFLLEILYGYIKSKVIVHKAKLISKWYETKVLFSDIPDIEKILELDILNLLLKHTKLIMVGNYICIPQALQEVLQIFETEIIQSYKILTNEVFEVERTQSASDEIYTKYNNEMEDSNNEQDSLKANSDDNNSCWNGTSSNSSNSIDKNSNTMNSMNFYNNAEEDVNSNLQFTPKENEYFFDSNDNINDENDCTIIVHDDNLRSETVYEKSVENSEIDVLIKKYFNNPLEKYHGNNFGTVLQNILLNNLSLEDKRVLLEDLYLVCLQDAVNNIKEQTNVKKSSTSEAKISQQDWNVLRKDLELKLKTLTSEKVTYEQRSELLLINQDNDIKLLKSGQEKYVKTIKKLDDIIIEVNTELNLLYKDNFKLKKDNMLKTLELQYFSNKSILCEANIHCNIALDVLRKINSLIQNYCGLHINSDLEIWSLTLSQSRNACQELELEFVKLKSWIESIIEDENMFNINMSYINPPACPEKSLSFTVCDTLTMLYKNTKNISQDLSELLSILLSYSTSDTSELIPSHLSTLKEFLHNKKIVEKNINDNLIIRRDDVEKLQENDSKNISENIDNTNKILQSNDIKQLEPENTETTDVPTNDIVNNNKISETCNDNDTLSPIFDMSNIIDFNLFMKSEDSIKEKDQETSDTTTKDDNTNTEEKNEKTKIDLTRELKNIPLKKDGHLVENLNVEFHKRSSLQYVIINEFLQDLHKRKESTENTLKEKDENNSSNDSNNVGSSSTSKQFCSFM